MSEMGHNTRTPGVTLITYRLLIILKIPQLKHISIYYKCGGKILLQIIYQMSFKNAVAYFLSDLKTIYTVKNITPKWFIQKYKQEF